MMSPKYFLSMHPVTYRLWRHSMDRLGYFISASGMPALAHPGNVFGFELRLDTHVAPVEVVERWLPPHDPFIIYDQSDKWWMWDVCRRGRLEYLPNVPVEIRPVEPIQPIRVERRDRFPYFTDSVTIVRPDFRYEIDEWIDSATRAVEYIQKTVARQLIEVTKAQIAKTGGSCVVCSDQNGTRVIAVPPLTGGPVTRKIPL